MRPSGCTLPPYLKSRPRWANLAQPEKGVTELEAMELARPCYE
jgi:hypothetical protein